MSKISVFGLGYVGVVTASCLANDGHFVLGVDPNETKVNLVREGKSPIIEPRTTELIQKAIAKGRLRATTNPIQSVMETEVSLICVGTPSQSNGDLDLKHIYRVSEQIGTALKEKACFHVVVCRSTALPGTMRNVVIPILEGYSGKQVGVDFGVCTNPEFLREGTAVYDFYHPPKVVIGEMDSRSGDAVVSLYSNLDAPIIRTDFETAEIVKYSDNAWHAVKICFANEIGNICKSLNIDGCRVMDIFCQDTRLNLSPCYLKPGFAFGGSCLPKDIRALTYKARTLDLDLPVLNSILPSNERQINRALRMILSHNNKEISMLGLSFKPGTDDLRESPIVDLAERLIGKGYDIRIYDRNVNLAKLGGANRDYIVEHIPHISALMVDTLDEALRHGRTIVIGNYASEFENVIGQTRPDQVVVDLVRIKTERTVEGRYEGICW